MKTVVFFLEGPSEREMLKGVLPKILPEQTVAEYQVFSGKQDLEKNLERRLHGWQRPNSVFVVLRDQDAGECHRIKEHLASICLQSGRSGWLVRVACHELESFFLGDLAAVEKGFGINGLKRKQRQQSYRNPDKLPNPTQVLERLISKPYNKMSGARAIAPHMDIESNRSHSFNVLVAGIKKLTEVE